VHCGEKSVYTHHATKNPDYKYPSFDPKNLSPNSQSGYSLFKMEEPEKSPITCQITDTLTGRPVANIPVTLTLLSSSLLHTHHYSFHGRTDIKGQMEAEWIPQPHSSSTHSGVLHSGTAFSDNPNPLPLDAVFEQATGEMEWRCTFATRQHFEDAGIRPLFTEADVKFVTDGFYGIGGAGVRREQWHLRLLLGSESFCIERSG
jgi:hypothetical protein